MKCFLSSVLLLLFSLFLVPTSALSSPSTSDDVFVTSPDEFGAIGDGKADDSVPISKALASCGDQELPCRVIFDSHYLSGPIILERSQITLEVNGEVSKKEDKDCDE